MRAPMTVLAMMIAGALLAACEPQSRDAERAEPTMAQAAATPASAIPASVGACVETSVRLVGPRLEGVPDSGSAIEYENGLMQVEYAAVPAIDQSRPGDRVRVCLTSIPDNCPANDERGRMFQGTNLRTGESWSAPNSEHSCGGA